MKEFCLKSELLLQAFWGGYMCKNNCFTHCQGYFNLDEGKYGRGFIEYCIARNFGIHRVPGHEQFYLKNSTNYDLLRQYGALKEEDINSACAEINELYQFVQTELRKSAYVKNGTVRLQRSLRPFEIKEITPQLLNNQKTIRLPVNIITSYSHKVSGEPEYSSRVALVREVPVEKIVMFDECLHHPENVCAHRIHGGEYEVWVVEDNMFGQIELDRECFKYKELDEKSARQNVHPFRGEPDASLYTVSSNYMRPCECGKITKWLIERNKEKIRKTYGL